MRNKNNETAEQLELRRLMKMEISTQTESYQGSTKRKIWKLSNGTIHRDFGPAIEWEDGSKFWHRHGLLHRVDGPARIENGNYGHFEEYFINGQKLTKEEFEKKQGGS
jgi:hypothetical protein